MKITFGELYDVLKEIENAEKSVAEWEHAVGNGGSESTMSRKMQGLESAKDWVEFLRSQPVDPPQELDPELEDQISRTDYRE